MREAEPVVGAADEEAGILQFGLQETAGIRGTRPKHQHDTGMGCRKPVEPSFQIIRRARRRSLAVEMRRQGAKHVAPVGRRHERPLLGVAFERPLEKLFIDRRNVDRLPAAMSIDELPRDLGDEPRHDRP